jgi:drug/metabolite transporter (DMT)-like permease
MATKILLVAFILNSVFSQLVLRRALNGLTAPVNFSDLPRFLLSAAASPWICASIGLQILSYIMWMLIVSREKLGVASASVGAGFYIVLAVSAWLIYGETLSLLQWAGIVLATLGVACISLGAAPY